MTDAFLKGVAISLLLIFSVGPVIFTIIKQSIVNGRKGGFSFAAGVWFSDVLWIVLSMGFSQVVKALMHFKIPISIAGCCFLIAMGIYFTFLKKITPRRLQEPPRMAGGSPSGNISSINYFAIFSSGFLLNSLNPAVISFWVLMAASLSAVYSFGQEIIVFVTCLAINMAADVAKVLGAGFIANKLSDHNILWLNRISGILYLAFGVVVLTGIIYSLLKH
jgi:threonine/homoserine/homoserine lactone efflux protein